MAIAGEAIVKVRAIVEGEPTPELDRVIRRIVRQEVEAVQIRTLDSLSDALQALRRRDVADLARASE